MDKIRYQNSMAEWLKNLRENVARHKILLADEKHYMELVKKAKGIDEAAITSGESVIWLHETVIMLQEKQIALAEQCTPMAHKWLESINVMAKPFIDTLAEYHADKLKAINQANKFKPSDN